MYCHYIVVREDFIDDANARTTYGIAAVKEYDGCVTVMQSISDVCPQFMPVLQLVQFCNELELEPIHLQDVVDDFLFEAP